MCETCTNSFRIPEEFFNHPEDLTLPTIQKQVGKSLAYSIRHGKENEEINQVGIEMIKKMFAQYTLKRQDGSTELKFNKKVCKAMGKVGCTPYAKNVF